MKKMLFFLMVLFVTIYSTQAAALKKMDTESLCINRTFVAYDDGDYFGKLELSSDCKFTLSTVDGEYFSGSYYIAANEGLEPGGMYTIVFNFSNGQTISTNYLCPLQGKQCISLDGFLFEAN